MSLAKQAILQALVETPEHSAWGYELMRKTGVKSGSLYPILRQLEEWGWLESRMEAVTADLKHRPRRYYRLTGLGLEEAEIAASNAAMTMRFRGAI